VAIPHRRIEMPRRHVFASTPLLIVSDLERSAGFYERVLGYEEPAFFGEPPEFCMLHRDEHDIMLQLADEPAEVRPNGVFDVWDVHLRVADLDAEMAAILAAGGSLAAGPITTEYEMREIEILDPDGHRICLGQDLEQRPEDLGR
jgi:catechol 2,3-dioxygenase-like lactoylglutathione lyase family enzyme